jgi:hypothetical protein
MTMKVVDYPIGELDFLLWRLQASLKVVDTARSLLLERPSDDDIEPAIIQILEYATRDARELMEKMETILGQLRAQEKRVAA